MTIEVKVIIIMAIILIVIINSLVSLLLGGGLPSKSAYIQYAIFGVLMPIIAGIFAAFIILSAQPEVALKITPAVWGYPPVESSFKV